jgi:hypothetical protein
MPLWKPFRKTLGDGSLTEVATLERRLDQRRAGVREAQAELLELKGRDQALLARINGIDAQLDVAEPDEVDALKAEQDQLRFERGPIHDQVEALEAGLPTRLKLVEEDELALERARFNQKCEDL